MPYTEDELFAKLERADAAGDSEAAQVLADEIRRIQTAAKPVAARPKKQAGPNFADVTSQWSSTAQQRTPKPKTQADRARTMRVRANAEADAIRAQATDPLEGMSGMQRGAAGFGMAYNDLYQGGKQRFVDQLLSGTQLSGGLPIGVEQVSSGLRGLGLDRMAGAVDQYAVNPLQRAKAGMQADVAAERVATEPLRVGSGAGISGNILGTLSQFAIPGVGMRGTAGIRANAAQGGLLGYMMPSVSDSETAINSTLGATAGAAIPVIGRTSNKLAQLLSRPKLTGAERRAGETILREAGGRPLNVEQSKVPGVRRTLGEATLDPGVMALERNARRTAPADFAELDMQNNLARVRALESFAGDEGMIAAAEAARAKAANPLLKAAKAVDGIDTNRLVSQISRLEKAQEGRPAIQTGLRQVRDLITRKIPDAERMQSALAPLGEYVKTSRGSATNREAAKEAIRQIKAGEWPSVSFTKGGKGTVGVGKTYDAAKDALAKSRAALGKETTGRDKLSELYNARKTINDMLSGKYGGDNAAALAGSRELIAVRNQLDRVLEKASPEFGQYMNTWRAGSKPIDRMKIGQELMGQKSGGAVLDPQTGVQQLTPAQFSKQARNLDRVAVNATGFRKAKAADYLRSEDIGSVRAIRDDLERQFKRAQNPAQPGSATMEAGELFKKTAVESLLSEAGVPVASKVSGHFQKKATEKLNAKLQELIANPAEFQRVLAALSPQQREVVSKALMMVGGMAGAGVVNNRRPQDRFLGRAAP